MKIITPVDDNGHMTKLDFDTNNSIFLAGPCPRHDYSDDWRFEAFKILEELGFNGNVITPTNDKYNLLEKTNALFNQTMWEYEAMHRCSALVFWIPRSEEHPARTTNIEFGDWYNKPGVFIGWPDEAIHNEYLEARMKLDLMEPRAKTLKEVLTNAVNYLNRPEDKYFTADTHFTQQRTLELSRRPFIDTWHMDMEMISNWNKTVTMNDIVYHAGDFGDITSMKALLSSLNYKKLIWVLGNYDRKIKGQIEEIIKELPNRNIEIHDNTTTLVDNDVTYFIVHEPDEGAIIPKYPESFALYGHIHGRAFAKENGIDLGTDYHRYTPISFEQVKWFKNAKQYWDHNVFCKEVTV